MNIAAAVRRATPVLDSPGSDGGPRIAPAIARAVRQLPRPAYRSIVAVIVLYSAAAVALIPFAGEKGPDLPSITPLFVGGVLATQLSTSFLLFVMTRAVRTWSMLVLGCAYLYGSLMAPFHLLTFPGGVLPDIIILGNAQSARWIYNFWYGGFGLLALIAILLEIRAVRIPAGRVGRATGVAVSVVVGAVAASVLLAIVAVEQLPPLIIGTSWTALDIVLIALETAVLVAGVGVVLTVLHRHNMMFLLLSLVLTAMAFSNILSIEGPGRYTVGWCAGRLSWFISASILFLFFMVQFARQQLLLTRSQDVLEARVASRTVDLTAAVKQRDLLLRELHHRVKNKMQIVDALLATQARHSRNAELRQTLNDLRSRIYVLALAHQQLMQSDFDAFDVAPFLQELTNNIMANGVDPSAELRLDSIALMVSIDFAAPLGLLVTELIIDCLEHSRPPGSGRIALTLRREADAVVLAIADNRSARRTDSGADVDKAALRTRVLKGLVRQLDATLSIRDIGGWCAEVTFARPKEAT
ncbi:MAG TPA: histidine kinase dimerization/phosphoacceptor domain -containing protein [Rhodopseudomonas sp.]|uniref:sensor histidine kinase n=1 Tax=Rhodopseudomonas sp. TaxID=1078 RepID=UPI002ED7E8C3